MNPFSAPAPAPVTGQVVYDSDLQPKFWGTPSETVLWFGLILLFAYLFFGIGVISGSIGIFSLLILLGEKRNQWITKFRSLLPKVIITGIAYQFVGFVLISGPNIVNTNRFFEKADVEFKRVRLVDSMNYRLSMSEIDLSSDQYGKLVSYYSAVAKEAEQEPEPLDRYPFGFGTFELAPTTLDRELLDSFDCNLVSDQLMLNFEHAIDYDWLDDREGANVRRNVLALLEAFPKIDETYGRCKVLVWHESQYGTYRFFIWFEDQQKGFLTCQAGGFG